MRQLSCGEQFTTFYAAEPYHEDYHKQHPNQDYCQQVITPKLAKLQERFLGKPKVL